MEWSVINSIIGLVANTVKVVSTLLGIKFRLPKAKNTSNLFSQRKVPELNEAVFVITSRAANLIALTYNTPRLAIRNKSEIDAKPINFINKVAEVLRLDKRKLLDLYLKKQLEIPQNDRHLLLETGWLCDTSRSAWHLSPKPPTFIYGYRYDFVCKKAAEAAQIEEKRDPFENVFHYAGSALLVNAKSGRVILHSRSELSTYHNHVHIFGGNFEPGRDADIKATIRREALEEVHTELLVDLKNCLYGLFVENTTNHHTVIALGASIPDKNFRYIEQLIYQQDKDDPADDEGVPFIVHIKELPRYLKGYMVPVGWHAIVTWIALGAPCAGKKLLKDKEVTEMLRELKDVTPKFDKSPKDALDRVAAN